MRFYLFVKSTFQGYQAACQEMWRKEWEYSTCLRPENAILPSHEINVSKVPSFVGANFRKYQDSCEQIIRILSA